MHLLGQVTIDVLPDDAMLEIFDCYMDQAREVDEVEAWHTLVHVCRRWRSIVFGSPNRLNLQLICRIRTPVKEMLSIWPALPIVIRDNLDLTSREDNIIAALAHSDRISELELCVAGSSQWEKVFAAMQKPFPVLTDLVLRSAKDTEPVLPDTFLGGTAQRLRFLRLNRISFPGLPKLLLSSATHIVYLQLWNVPRSGYISPEVMATCLSALTSLKELRLTFESPRSLPDRGIIRHFTPTTPATRAVLPALIRFRYRGMSEYLEDLAARIDAPMLHSLKITLLNQLIFDTSNISEFISRTPKFKVLDEARVAFDDWEVSVTFPRTVERLHLGILCRQSDWQLSSLAQVCGSSLPLVSSLGHLYIYNSKYLRLGWQDDDVENAQWLELLRPFTAVKNLHLCKEFAPRVAAVMEELVGESVTEVLPALRNIFVEGYQPSVPLEEGIRRFIAARHLSSEPIKVSHWDREQDKW